MKKFFGKITNGIKKLFRLITNKWLLKGTTTIFLVALVIAGYIGLNWAVEQVKIEDLDFTTKKLYSLSDDTKERLEVLESDITIQLINLKDYKYYNIIDGNYIIEYVNKYTTISEKITVEEINDISTRIDLQEKYGITSSDLLIIVKNGDRETIITINDLVEYEYATGEYLDKTEEAVTNAIMEVTIEDKPHIYFLTGKTYYRTNEVLATILYQLEDESNEVNNLDILSTGNVPEDCDCLVITTLKTDLSELERDKILEYINKGGKILILSSQNMIDVDTPNFDQVLAQYGISIGYGSIFEQDSSQMLVESPELIIADVNASFMSDIDMSLEMCGVTAGKIEFSDETKLKELGVTYEKIATTSEKSFVRTKFDIDSITRTDEDSQEGSCIIGAHVTKDISDEKNSELIIYSNEIMATNITIPINMQYAIYPIYERNNKDVILNSISYLTEREDIIKIRKLDEEQSYTVTDQEDVIIKTIIFVVPFLIIGTGIVVMVIRKRRI